MKNLVIDKRVIKSNLQAVKERADGAAIYADLSGDAFGMGLLETARLLRDEGIRHFAVSDQKDAAVLRKNSFEEERIMMLRSTADSNELEQLIDLNVICTVGSYDAAVAINGIAEARKTVCEVQVKIDTGLGRYGFMPAETDKIAAIYKYMPNLAVVGMFTTFSASWKSKKITLSQLDMFNEVLDKLISMGYDVGAVHACDSAALFRYDFGRMDAVRVGTALSGRVAGKSIPGLHKVGYIEAGLEEVGWFPKGHRIGGNIILKSPTKLAVLSVGYYHGFGVTQQEDHSFFEMLKSQRRRRYVKFGSQKARVLGDIGMMHTIVDVTKIDCTVGDIAVMDVDPVNVKGLLRVYKTA
ncbi:MAG: alanine racemase [Oscillospiraceae bacterium]